jgi:hypothetical protein
MKFYVNELTQRKKSMTKKIYIISDAEKCSPLILRLIFYQPHSRELLVKGKNEKKFFSKVTQIEKFIAFGSSSLNIKEDIIDK